MSTIRRQDIRKSLRDKGFKQENDIWYFWHEGKKTDIRVKLSSGQKYREYGDNALSCKIKPLKFQKLKQVKDLFSCPMGEKEYLKYLDSIGFDY